MLVTMDLCLQGLVSLELHYTVAILMVLIVAIRAIVSMGLYSLFYLWEQLWLEYTSHDRFVSWIRGVFGDDLLH